MSRVTYVNARLNDEETKMLDKCLSKYKRFKWVKGAVLAEALRMYYQSQEANQWRMVNPPSV